MLWQALCLFFATALLWRILVFVQGFLRTRREISKLPCPPGAQWLTGHNRLRPFSPGMQWLRDTVKAFPRAYTLWLGPVPFPVLCHPDTMKLMLSSPTGTRKSGIYELARDWIGEGLVSANGPKWKRNRRLLTHSFHLDVLRTYVPVYNNSVEVLLGKMDRLAAEGKPLRVNSELNLSTFDSILRTAFSHQSNCQLEDRPKEGELDMLSATDTVTRVIQERQFNRPLLANPWLFWLSSLYSEFMRATMYLHGVANELIGQRKEEIHKKMENGDALGKPRDFLDSLLLARDADGSGLTNQEIVDEVNTFLFAGHETTATSLTWLLYYLAKYPQHQTKIREEVDEILAGRDSDRITIKDFPLMEYMTLVIRESMRMNNAIPMVSRLLTAPYDVDGVTLPAGTTLFLSIYQLHHNPAVWGDDHMEFRPSRFLPENLAKMDPFAYVPFSAGSRNCIGQQFALNEIKVFLARILRRFRLSLVEGQPEAIPMMTSVLKPQHEVLLTVELISPKSQTDS